MVTSWAVAVAPPQAAARLLSSGPVVIPRPAERPGLSYLTLTARAGRSARAGELELLNPSSRSVRLALAPVDGFTLDTLGSAYAPRGARTMGAARWLRVGRRALELPAHSRASVPVAVRIPRAAAAGDYLSGVSVEDAHQHARRTLGRGAAAVSAVRYAIGVEISVPGRRHPLIRFSGASVRREPGEVSFLLDAHNLGNEILRGVHGHVRIEHDGRILLHRAIAPGTFVAHTGIAYPVPVPGLHPAEGDRYEISAWLHYGARTARLDTTVAFGRRAAAVQRRYGGPGGSGGSGWWKDALLVALVLYMIVTTLLLLRRRRDGARAGTAAHGRG